MQEGLLVGVSLEAGGPRRGLWQWLDETMNKTRVLAV